MKIESPILYCCYNRLDLIKKSLDIIQKIECKKIYISIDGPKNTSQDIKKNQDILNYIQNLSFSSKKELLINDKNKGCKFAISNAIDWFFENEEQGIILEEDLLPSKSFFNFCDYALNKYKNNSNVMMISGTNYLGEKVKSNNYFYSEHFLIWGWATWKRSWNFYDVEMKSWKKESVKLELQKRYSSKEYNFLKNRFNSYFKDYSDTWDIQWYFSCVYNKGLTVMPEANLVTNIGVEGTHSKKYYDTLFLECGELEIEKINSPTEIKRNYIFDLKLHKKYNFKNFILVKIKLILKKIFFFLN
tara:strand:- start:634 stop:1539 length:906 start_codon:yes stop_codon:yes gene_type:complete